MARVLGVLDVLGEKVVLGDYPSWLRKRANNLRNGNKK
jgi:hypothetical protein